MSNPFLDWVIAHKEWCFSTLCAAFGGAFAILKWVWPLAKGREKSRSGSETSIVLGGTGNTLTAVGIGATVNGGVIVGSHNVQNVVINHNQNPVEIPIRDRKSSTPTGNEIRQRQKDALNGIPLVLKGDVLQKYLDGFVNLPVAWPIKIDGVWPRTGSEDLRIGATYGEEAWGACIRFNVRGSDFPILKTLEDGHLAFVQGRICEINEYVIELEVSNLEFE
jgi:hypothetical protein